DQSVADFGDWHFHAGEGINSRVDFLVHQRLAGYALSGGYAQESELLNKVLISQFNLPPQ
ncbi:MAG: hypothetical protein ACYC3N_09755, partial [Halothiobacillus sp.]